MYILACFQSVYVSNFINHKKIGCYFIKNNLLYNFLGYDFFYQTRRLVKLNKKIKKYFFDC